ncbi:hypothetical protein [Burkholderia pseudomallei]|uniref:hypothetical protein n=1 Tax=Burkholderia pseudomallei TaxID=28450 RepID=UPI000572355E|nr:hypothetical protein [Burkholderia pseudomallei]APY94213.1 hypothetical protein BGI50_15685 [Burkholderia pseudomallei]OMO13746.1 hypothetical protein BGI48_15730 [Burkholderia pseudomallei]OMW69697.1 hypothetical protein AQ811_14495 [Burkholderia pseudomallei]OMZ92100.1 hypothetical protein AQ874_18345 [Burkholderia pseudomallei]ONB61242.1 hypothetical protein AQ902_25995 [Burkholderia pseudomallei]
MASGVSGNEPTARAFPKPTLEFTARSPGTAVEVKARRRDAYRMDVLRHALLHHMRERTGLGGRVIRLGVALAQLSTSCNVSTAAHRESGAAGTR